MRAIKNDLNGFQSENKQKSSKNSRPENSEAVFIGWQETPWGTMALYNITKTDHPLYRSTVTEDTLRTNNLKIPRISCSK
jgi:hypothetical protein